jgi:hypothetical protein
MLAGGDLETLTEDHSQEELPNTIELSFEAESSPQRRQNSGVSGDPDSDEPREPSKVYHRAITSLYAGTDPEASRLNGKVRVSVLPNGA